MTKLVLIRHGESIANARNEYTGWSDVPLTKKGIAEAHNAGQILAKQNIKFTDVHTSVLKRAIKTAYIVQDECDISYLPIHKTWRLNERHYGALRGLNKDYTRKIYGPKQVALWRRSYSSVPPKLKRPDTGLRVYQRYPQSILPLAESLKMALHRSVPYYQDHIAPKLIDHHDQLVVAHGSTIRGLIKYLENISDTGIDGVEVGNAQPIVYEFDDKLNIIDKTTLK